jgi:hypothetical protein
MCILLTHKGRYFDLCVLNGNMLCVISEVPILSFYLIIIFMRILLLNCNKCTETDLLYVHLYENKWNKIEVFIECSMCNNDCTESPLLPSLCFSLC